VRQHRQYLLAVIFDHFHHQVSPMLFRLRNYTGNLGDRQAWVGCLAINRGYHQSLSAFMVDTWGTNKICRVRLDIILWFLAKYD
jgi:hypothetical protein